MVDLMVAAIPGQSLTDTPKNSPWERPPEMVKVPEIVDYYISSLADNEKMEDLAVLFEIGGDLRGIVKTITSTGAMKGLHTVEAGILAAPVIASFIKAAMSEYGIEVRETSFDAEKAQTMKEKERLKTLVMAAMEKEAQQEGPTSGILQEIRENIEPEAEEPMEEAPLQEQPQEQSKGIMSRGAV